MEIGPKIFPLYLNLGAFIFHHPCHELNSTFPDFRTTHCVSWILYNNEFRSPYLPLLFTYTHSCALVARRRSRHKRIINSVQCWSVNWLDDLALKHHHHRSEPRFLPLSLPISATRSDQVYSTDQLVRAIESPQFGLTTQCVIE